VLRVLDEPKRHPQYDSTTYVNDIALLRTTRADGIAPVRLGVAPEPGTHVWGIGWGRVKEDGPPSLTLLEVDVPIVGPRECSTAYRPTPITSGMLCADDKDRDACQGDSGGPLLSRKEPDVFQIGVVSFGRGCGRKGAPGVYTRVESYRDWIQAETGLALQ
jgi:secreted trypsin-like serine protease